MCPLGLAQPTWQRPNSLHAARDGDQLGGNRRPPRFGMSRERCTGPRSSRAYERVPRSARHPGKAPFRGVGTEVDRGLPWLCRVMVACSEGSRAERSDRGAVGAERPLPSHTWKGPLPMLHYRGRSPAGVDRHAVIIDKPDPRRRAHAAPRAWAVPMEASPARHSPPGDGPLLQKSPELGAAVVDRARVDDPVVAVAFVTITAGTPLVVASYRSGSHSTSWSKTPRLPSS